MLKPKGIFIATFDIPGLQLYKFESLFDTKIIADGIPLSGNESQIQNVKYSHLNCGFMVVQKL